MTRPGHVHLRLTAANLGGLDRWAEAHDLSRNEAANRLFERFMGGEEVGQIQRAVMLVESIAVDLETLDDARSQTAARAGFAHLQLLRRLTSIELIATEILFLLRASISSMEPATYKEVQTGMRSVTSDLRRQLRHDMRELGLADRDEETADDGTGEDMDR